MTDNLIEMDFGGPSRMAGAEIRAELGRQGRSQRWLSQQLFVNQAWISRRISPTSDVDLTLEEIVRVAEVLRVPIQRFLSVLSGPESPNTLVRSYLTAVAPVIDLDAYRAERAA